MWLQRATDVAARETTDVEAVGAFRVPQDIVRTTKARKPDAQQITRSNRPEEKNQ